MGFSETVKASVRRKSHFQCCLCKSLGVEIHHIIPEAEGGPDTEDNAAPLCPSCHEIYGANPIKRKFITEARDFWYEVCRNRYASDNDKIERLIVLLEGTTSTLTGFQEFVNRVVNLESAKSGPQTHPLSGSATGTSWASGNLTVGGDNEDQDEVVEEDEEFRQEPRTEIEILEALDRLFDQIWYNRHWNHRIEIEEGTAAVDPSVWKQALAAAARVEEKYKDDPEALGPWSDFEWGMLNGKMSALRWALGDEWDFLDI